MKRLLYITTVGLVLAGIVHILIVLLIPSYATKDAWAKLEQVGEPWQFSIVAQPGSDTAQLPFVDPSFGIAACRFNLNEAPLIVETKGELPFWSVALFDRQGRNIYSFNNRTAIERQLSLIVVNAVQMAQIRKNPPEQVDKSVLVQSVSNQGFILIRALEADSSWKSAVSKFLNDASCEKFDIILEEENT